MSETSFHSLDEDVRLLNQVSRAASAPDFLRMAIRGAYRDRIALVVTDGAAASVLLHMVAGIDRNTPVIVPDAPMPRTPVARLGLGDVRVAASLAQALDGFEAWIDGRPNPEPYGRRALVDVIDGRLRISPLALWSDEDIGSYLTTNDLSRVPVGGGRTAHH